VQQLGVSSKLGFYDVYSTSEEELLSLIPRPVYALLCIIPSAIYGKARDLENEKMTVYEGAGENEPVMWVQQTIGNACGLMALLHGVCNGGSKQYILRGSDLENLLHKAVPLKPEARAQLLYDSAALEAAHMSAATTGDTCAPSSSANVPYHYVCFVKADNDHLYELNGGMKGPVDRGLLGSDEDALSAKALLLGVGSFLEEAGDAHIGFSIVAMAPADG